VMGLDLRSGGKRLEMLREFTRVSRLGFFGSPITWDRYSHAMREVAAQLAVSTCLSKLPSTTRNIAASLQL
jgi:hypothetical protein